MAILLVVMLTSLLQSSLIKGTKETDTALVPVPRQLGKHLVVGDRVRFGNIRLTIRHINGSQIEIIGLKLQDKQV
ncbi:MAG: cell volume regulation protein A [Marinomonas primoryensis]|jgi:cell volume regulation protein A